MKPTSVLDNIRIASPCHAAWEDMPGDDRIRHCRDCDLNVYNFASMTGDEISAVIRSTEGRLCARLFRRADGTLLTADCPSVQRRERHNAFVRAGLALCGLCAALIGCGPKRPTHTAGRVQVMGDIAVLPATNCVALPPAH